MNEFSVDILLATFNGAKFLPEQIDSIINQSHQNFRLIVRDDNSSDMTANVLKTYLEKYPSKILLLTDGNRHGVKGNFSTLMANSSSQYIAFADQDDVWDKDKIKTSLEKMRQLESQHSATTPLLVHTDLQVVDENKRIISHSFWSYSGLKPSIGRSLNRLLIQNVVTGCATMINRPLLQLAYPIPENAVMHDWWLALVASALGHIDEVCLPTVLYRQHGKNAVGAKKLYSLAYIKRGLKRPRDFHRERGKQAEEFFARYIESFSEEQKDLIKAFIRLPSESYMSRIFTTFKYRLFRMGLLRNLVGIFLRP